jgi:hypothetical protein
VAEPSFFPQDTRRALSNSNGPLRRGALQMVQPAKPATRRLPVRCTTATEMKPFMDFQPWAIRPFRPSTKYLLLAVRTATSITEIQTVSDPADFPVIALESLVLMKLTSNRRKDQVHVQDMIGVGLIDPSWLTKLPPELALRLKHIMDTPDS